MGYYVALLAHLCMGWLSAISRMRTLELLGVCAMLFGRRGNAAKREQCFWLRNAMSFGAVLVAAHGS